MSSEAQAILARAQARGQARAHSAPRPDYKAAKPILARQKGALTRAVNSKDTDKVILACTKAVREWSEPPFDGAWPDHWSDWQRALDDALPPSARVRLEDLD
jgi:hypothetical protein